MTTESTEHGKLINAGREAMQRFGTTLVSDDNEFDFWFNVFAYMDDTTNHKRYWMAIGARASWVTPVDPRKFGQIRQKFCAAMIERVAKRKLTDKLRAHLIKSLDIVKVDKV